MTDPTPKGRERATAREILLICLAGGLLAAAIEVTTLGLFRTLFPRISRTADAFVWVVPLYYLAFFGAMGIAMVLVSRFLPRMLALQIGVTASAALVAFVGLLLGLYEKTYQWTLVILALGIGVQVGRWALRHESVLFRRLRVMSWVLAVPLLLVGAGLPVYWQLQERSSTRNLVEPRAAAPSVLLIIFDTVRAASMGLYGLSWQNTPRLAQLAERSVVFNRAYSTAPWTLPSHATMFTGRYGFELSTNWLTPLDGTYPTLAEVFRDSGYRTGGFVANLTYTSRETGLARGFIHYEDYPIRGLYLKRATALSYFFNTWDRKEKPGRRTVARKSAPWLIRDFLSWVDREPQRPFFAFLNFFEAHQPYRPAPEFRRSPGTGNEELDEYEAAIATLDAQVGKLLDSLAARGLLENTIVVVSSDHGEHFGEFNLFGHAKSLHSPQLHVPLLIAGGPVPHGLRVDAAVTLRDLAATIADISDLGHRFPGTSLGRFWKQATPASGGSPILAHMRKGLRTPPEEPVSRGDMASIIRENLQLIVNGDGEEELYDLGRSRGYADDLRDSSRFQRAALGLMAALKAATSTGGLDQSSVAHTRP